MSGFFAVAGSPLLAALVFGISLAQGSAVAMAADSAPAPSGHSVTVDALPPSMQIDASTDHSGDDPNGERAERRRTRARHADIRIGPDGDYSSFSALMESDPWLAALIFMSVALFFLVPIVLVLGIFWYKLRRVRMQNETMIAMAEKGVVAPVRAGDAAAAGSPAYAAGANIEQMVAARKRSGMSDLRKGALMIAAGLALTFFSLIDDQSANSVGLTLLFVGIAYTILWWIEERKAAPETGLGVPPPR